MSSNSAVLQRRGKLLGPAQGGGSSCSGSGDATTQGACSPCSLPQALPYLPESLKERTARPKNAIFCISETWASSREPLGNRPLQALAAAPTPFSRLLLALDTLPRRRQAKKPLNMTKLTIVPRLHVDDKQNATGGLKASTDHGNATYSVSVTDKGVRGGDVMDGLCLGMKLHDGSLEAVYEPGNGHHILRVQRSVTVRDKDVRVKITDMAGAERATYINCSVGVDDNNTAKVIYKCNPGSKLDHRNAIVGWVYCKDDIELEPRFNLGTESLSAGVTWKVDDENKLRAVFDMSTNEGALTWTNSGSLGGGGSTKLTARMKLDKDSMQQMPTLTLTKDWDVDF
ncbi:hypothetical protein ABPG75_011216 [Micractinium tetrahymenae]